MDSVDFIKSFPLRTFSRGEVIIQRDEDIMSLFALREGFVKVTSINTEGVERLVWLVGRYDLAPTEQLFSRRGTTRFFYTALTDGSYYEIDKQVFLKKAFDEPQLMTEVARSMSVHYDDFLFRVDALDATTVKERLLRTLCYLSERLSSEATVNLYDYGLKLTHGDIAAMIGSTRETTSLVLSDIRKEGLIDYTRTKFIVDVVKISEMLETALLKSN